MTILVVIATASSSKHIELLIEKRAYAILKQLIKIAGKSSEDADCIVTIIKWQGVTRELTDIRNILQPQKLAEILYQKMNFANSVCSNTGPFVIFGILIVILCIVFAFWYFLRGK